MGLEHPPQEPGRRSRAVLVAEIPTTGPRCRKRGYGWDAVASAIVIDMAHLLPPPAPNWPSWLLSERHYYRADASLVVDTYEGRWRDEQTGEGGTVFTLLVRLLGSWGAARRWLREGEYMYGIGPGPRREPGGRRGHRQKRRSENGGALEVDRFWSPVRVQRTETVACPAPLPQTSSSCGQRSHCRQSSGETVRQRRGTQPSSSTEGGRAGKAPPCGEEGETTVEGQTAGLHNESANQV